jgi:hydrogenase-4 component H
MSYIRLLKVASEVGRVTRRYPREAGLVTEYFRGAIEIDPTRCWGCGACTLACPPNALSIKVGGEGVTIEYFIGRCIFCGRCAEVCPKNAVKITRKFEYASTSLQGLVRRVTQGVTRCPLCGKPVGAEAEVRAVAEVVRLVKDSTSICPDCKARTLAEGMVRHRPRRGYFGFITIPR